MPPAGCELHLHKPMLIHFQGHSVYKYLHKMLSEKLLRRLRTLRVQHFLYAVHFDRF